MPPIRTSEGIATLLAFVSRPLVLVGVVGALFFGVLTWLIKSGIFPQLAQWDAPPLIHRMLDYGFVIGLAVVVLGFALQFYRRAGGRWYGFLVVIAVIVLGFGLLFAVQWTAKGGGTQTANGTMFVTNIKGINAQEHDALANSTA